MSYFLEYLFAQNSCKQDFEKDMEKYENVLEQ